MLTSVPNSINRAARMVVLNHPNSIPCTVYRKQVLRAAATGAAAGETIGGLPLLGGIPVVSAEDEADADYEELGDAKCILLGNYGGTQMLDTKAGAGATPEQEARVECVAEPGSVNSFEVQKHDLVMLQPGGGAVLTFEVLQDLNTVNIPPFVRKVVLGFQADLVHIPAVEDEVALRI